MCQPLNEPELVQALNPWNSMSSLLYWKGASLVSHSFSLQHRPIFSCCHQYSTMLNRKFQSVLEVCLSTCPLCTSRHIETALTFETTFSLRKMNPTQLDTVSITSKAHRSTLFSHVITILPASVMGEYFEGPYVTIIHPSYTLRFGKHLLFRMYNKVK